MPVMRPCGCIYTFDDRQVLFTCRQHNTPRDSNAQTCGLCGRALFPTDLLQVWTCQYCEVEILQ